MGIKKFREKVKARTARNSGVSIGDVIDYVNPLLRGFAFYFRITDCKKVLSDLACWVRRRIRAIQMKLWKKAGKLHRRLRQLGYKGAFSYIKMNSWRNVSSPLAHYAMPNDYLHKDLGLFDISKVHTENLFLEKFLFNNNR